MEKDFIFTGTIMQRTWFETNVVGPDTVRGKTVCWIRKEHALLYKTKNGFYVDLDSLNKRGDFKKADKIVERTQTIGSFWTGKRIEVMPAVPFSDINNGEASFYGIFVDEDSLQMVKDKNIGVKKQVKMMKR